MRLQQLKPLLKPSAVGKSLWEAVTVDPHIKECITVLMCPYRTDSQQQWRIKILLLLLIYSWVTYNPCGVHSASNLESSEESHHFSHRNSSFNRKLDSKYCNCSVIYFENPNLEQPQMLPQKTQQSILDTQTTFTIPLSRCKCLELFVSGLSDI